MFDTTTFLASLATVVGFSLSTVSSTTDNAAALDAAFGPLVLKLVDLFGQAGLFLGFILFLLRALREQYDSRIALQEKRIEAAERKIDECEKDRTAIHGTLELVRQEQLRELRQMHNIAERFPVIPPPQPPSKP